MRQRCLFGVVFLVGMAGAPAAFAQGLPNPYVTLSPATAPLSGATVVTATANEATFSLPASVMGDNPPNIADATILTSTPSRILFVPTNNPVYIEIGLTGLTYGYPGQCGMSGGVCPSLFSSYASTGATTALTLARVGTGAIVAGQPISFTTTFTASATAADDLTVYASLADANENLGLVGIGPLSAGTATTTFSEALPAGTQQVVLYYEGDTNYLPNYAPVVSVTVDQATSQVALAASPTTASLGEPVTVTATVSAIAPGGGVATSSVSLADTSTTPATSYGDATLDATGTATWTLSFTKTSTPHLVATYGGDSNFTASASGVLTETVTDTVWDAGVVDSGADAEPGDAAADSATPKTDAGEDAGKSDAGEDASVDSSAPHGEDGGSGPAEDSGVDATVGGGADASDDAAPPPVLDDSGTPVATNGADAGDAGEPGGGGSQSGGGCSVSDAPGSGSLGAFPLAALVCALAARRRRARPE